MSGECGVLRFCGGADQKLNFLASERLNSAAFDVVVATVEQLADSFQLVKDTLNYFLESMSALSRPVAAARLSVFASIDEFGEPAAQRGVGADRASRQSRSVYSRLAQNARHGVCSRPEWFYEFLSTTEQTAGAGRIIPPSGN